MSDQLSGAVAADVDTAAAEVDAAAPVEWSEVEAILDEEEVRWSGLLDRLSQ